jgi:hypothetical protein
VRHRTPAGTSRGTSPAGHAGGVIAEVSAALRGLYGPLMPDGVPLRFGPPAADTADAVCFFLASVEEDGHAAPADWADVRDEQGRVIGRRPPVRRFDLLYLVTAWAGDGRREEALLDAVLAATVPTTRLSPELLTGSLVGPDAWVLVRLEPRAGRIYADLGLPPRTVLGLSVNAPLILPLDTDVAAPAEQITLGVDRRGPAGSPQPRGGANGREPGRWRRSRIDEHAPPDGTPPDDTAPGGTARDGTAQDSTAPDSTAQDSGGAAGGGGAGEPVPPQRARKESHARRGEAG